MAGAVKMKLSNSEIRKVNGAIKRYGINLENDLKDETQRLLLDITAKAKENVRDNGSIATSRLINSITSSPSSDRKGGFVIVNAIYGAAVEFGRKAGGIPPIAPILTWVRKKGLASTTHTNSKGKTVKDRRDAAQEDEELSMAIAIAKSIGKNGTKAKPFLMPAFTSFSSRYFKRLKVIIKQHERKVK